ncbi:MAG: amidophosphoribosyltransferase [Candidatus Cloacimonetes bacterium]|nr:amidophosphoribosyltransferase [Candidatus Cloacimonadota bacterium]MDD2650568.1 amidophosphoribosyltransferase [Candidatus Cloacimonadota bacterium]
MCGIVGVFNQQYAAEYAARCLYAEQHRGQESCGIAVSDSNTIRLEKQMGLVKDVFTPEVLETLPGNIAIGHVRYPTRGSATATNTQPHVVELLSGPSYALASNGDIVNYFDIRRQLEAKGVWFKSNNDGELILKYIVHQIEKEGKEIASAIKSMMKEVRGAYSAVLMTRNELYMFRDPYGFRPMSWGKLVDDSVVVASETCALDILDTRNVQVVHPGEIIVVSERGIKHINLDVSKYRNTDTNRHCIFEHIYFSRPDSFDFEEDVYVVRQKIGELLAEDDHDLKPDLIVPVPDSSNFIAQGYAEAKKMHVTYGLIRNHYVGRTFIKPDQKIRDESVRQKFNTLAHLFKDKVVVLIDDSIVRGTTIRSIIKLILNAGAKEVHLRIGSPQVKFACYYGIDTPNKEDLIANKKTIEEIREYLNVTSYKHIDIKTLKKSVGKPDNFCYACFDGKYPL